MQEKYDSLTALVESLDVTINDKEIKGLKEYIEQLQDIKYKAQNELEEIEPKLQEQRDREERQQDREYMGVAI